MPRPARDPKKAIAYLRCSTDRQDLRPHAQREAISAWAAREGIMVVAWHQDRGVSGGAELEDRPGLTTALADPGARGAGVLVVARRDRLARDVLNAALVERLVECDDGRILSADGCANGDGARSPEMPDEPVFMHQNLKVCSSWCRRIRGLVTLGQGGGSPPYR